MLPQYPFDYEELENDFDLNVWLDDCYNEVQEEVLDASLQETTP